MIVVQPVYRAWSCVCAVSIG